VAAVPSAVHRGSDSVRCTVLSSSATASGVIGTVTACGVRSPSANVTVVLTGV